MGEKPLNAQERREKVTLGPSFRRCSRHCPPGSGGHAMQIKFFQDFLNTKLIPDEKYVSDRCEALATIHEKFKVCIGNYNRCGCP
jgi:hypothetical protein